MRRILNLAIAFASLLVFIFPNALYAQTQPAVNQGTTENAQTYFNKVIQSAPAQLSSCTTDRSAVFDYCSDTFTTAKTVNVPGVPITEVKAGDKLICYRVNLNALNFAGDRTPACKYTPAGGGDQYIWGGSALGGTETCTNGECTTQSAVDRALNAATNAVSDAASTALNGVAIAILGFANLMLAMAGTLLNWVVVKAVFQFGSLIGNSPGLLAAWGVLRDIGNMLLLFGFILMGLATILDLHSFPTKKAIPRLLIFAILMNFSLFAAEAVIDVANTFSATIYAQANTSQCPDIFTTEAGAAADTKTECSVNYGIAGHIMQSSGLSSIFSLPQGASFTNNVAVYLGLALFATIGAIVLFAAAIMLSIRLIVLTFLMVTSPIGFAGMAIPPLRRFADDWWNKLLHQAFYAPILFILIFISLKVTDSFANAATRGSLAGALTQPSASVMGIIMIFVVIIGFMLASIIMANRFGAAGASFATNLATRTVMGTVTRGTNFAIGGSASGLRYAQQRYAPNSKIGKFANKRILSPLAGANLDMRRIPGVAKGLSAAGAGSAVGAAEHATFADMKHQYQDIRDNKSGKKSERDYQGRVKTQSLEDEAHHGSVSGDNQKFLRGLSEKQLMELHGIKDGNGAMAQNLTPEQFDKLMNNDDLDSGAKAKLKDARYGSVRGAVEAAAIDPDDDALQTAAKEAVTALTGKDLGHLATSSANSSLLRNDKFTSLLSDDQFKELRKNTNLTPQQQVALDLSREKKNSPEAIADQISTMNAEGINKLPGGTIKDTRVLNNMSGKQIASINTERLAPAEIGDVVAFINLQKSIGTPRWTQFITAFKANPRVRQRWEEAGISIDPASP